jgi:hypothetical protein
MHSAVITNSFYRSYKYHINTVIETYNEILGYFQYLYIAVNHNIFVSWILSIGDSGLLYEPFSSIFRIESTVIACQSLVKRCMKVYFVCIRNKQRGINTVQMPVITIIMHWTVEVHVYSIILMGYIFNRINCLR